MALFRRTLSPEKLAARTEKQKQKEDRARARQQEREAREAAARLHETRMDKAAGISSVLLICHRDTLSIITANTGRLRYAFGGRAWPKGLVKQEFSGPDIVAILDSMHKFRDGLASPTIRPVARRVYAAIAEVVDGIDASAKPGSPVPDIVIDDRIGDTPE